MKPQLLIDIGSVVSLIIGFIVVIRAIKKVITETIEPHVKPLVKSVNDVSDRVKVLESTVLTEAEHLQICTASTQRINAMEKSLCAKIQLLTDLIYKVLIHPEGGSYERRSEDTGSPTGSERRLENN